MLNKLKKWNWSTFGVILLVAGIGALSNKSITNTTDCILVALMFGIPLGLLWSWLGREE